MIRSVSLSLRSISFRLLFLCFVLFPSTNRFRIVCVFVHVTKSKHSNAQAMHNEEKVKWISDTHLQLCFSLLCSKQFLTYARTQLSTHSIHMRSIYDFAISLERERTVKSHSHHSTVRFSAVCVCLTYEEKCFRFPLVVPSFFSRLFSLWATWWFSTDRDTHQLYVTIDRRMKWFYYFFFSLFILRNTHEARRWKGNFSSLFSMSLYVLRRRRRYSNDEQDFKLKHFFLSASVFSFDYGTSISFNQRA